MAVGVERSANEEPLSEPVGSELANHAGESPPVLPGFREMALRTMARERIRLLADLAARRQAAGLSQTAIAARMGTSQSAVARLEAGGSDVRISTLERYAAALGSQLRSEERRVGKEWRTRWSPSHSKK